MKTIHKVQLIIWTKNTVGEPEFFVIQRPLQKDCVVLTGKIGDKPEIKDESTSQAAIRELYEELHVKPLHIVDLNIQTKAKLNDNIISIEHPFLIEIAAKNVKFLEYEAKEAWIDKKHIINNLTYKTQQDSVQHVLNNQTKYFQ